MKPYTICLWFDDQGEAAAKFYTAIFKGKIHETTRYGEGSMGTPGKVMTVRFTANGQEFVALNGGPIFKPNEAFSLMVTCKNQKEIDFYWKRLLAGGGKESMCGWLKDQFGFSWQIVPDQMQKLVGNPGGMKAMMKMHKLDIAALKAAATPTEKKSPKRRTAA